MFPNFPKHQKSAFQNTTTRPGGGNVASYDAPIGTIVPIKLQRACFQSPDTLLAAQKFFIRRVALPVGGAIASLPKMERETIICYILDYDEELSIMMSNSYLLYLYNYLLVDDKEVGIKRYFTVFLGILINFLDTTAGPRMVMILNKMGYNVTYSHINIDRLNYLISTTINDSIFKKYSEMHPGFEDGFHLILICSILTLLGKRITIENNQNFFMARFKAFGNKMGCKDIAELLIAHVFYPETDNCADAYSLISSYHSVRKEIFETILATSRLDSRLKGGLEVLLRYLAGTEMTHIILIDQWLMCRYPELMSMRILRGYEGIITAAYEFLDSIKAEERLYVKLLYTEHETQCIHANLFHIPLLVAREIASIEIVSFTNYTMKTSQEDKEILDIVRNYLKTSTTKLGPSSIAFSRHNQMNDITRHQMMEEVFGSNTQAIVPREEETRE